MLPRALSRVHALAVAGALVAAAPPRAGPVRAQEIPAPDDRTPHSEARLAVETLSARPGASLAVGLVLTLDPGWHTYWRNPGDSGSEAVLEWDLPAGLSAGAVQWPRPELVPYPPLMSYAYHGTVMLLTDVAVAPDVPPGSALRVGLRASWLVCQEICLPADTLLTVEVPVADAAPAPDPAWEGLFRETRALLPVKDAAWTARALETSAGYTLEMRAPRGWSERPAGVHFFPADPTALDHVRPQEPAWEGDQLRLTLARSPYNTGPAALEGVLVRTDGGGFARRGGTSGAAAGAASGATGSGVALVRPALAVSAPVVALAGQPGPGASPEERTGGVPATEAGAGLAVALLLAFAGGVLLNLMPCVFPVLSLKILGFVRHAGGDPSVTRRHGVAFGAGVVASFLALAGALLAVRAAGTQVGWGFQLQSPPIVALLAVLVFVIGLVLAGVWEPGAALTRLGAVGAEDDSLRGSFLTGVLAAVVATPCTAPFMGAAIGVALVRPAAEGLAIFAVLGAGMAAPYMV
ncbi:MAG: thiol:disulfide interchange protein, partial [Gemmatimonadetes bacterium]|nr:thiol:disulfide interchange protein [Gemmatimonadota bacterium]